jgi:hypothetical protein
MYTSELAEGFFVETVAIDGNRQNVPLQQQRALQ